MNVPRLTFGKHERLRGSLRIREVATTGTGLSEAPFRLIAKVMDLPEATPLQVAFAVPKRHMPRAVDRNRMKRRMREAFRLIKPACATRLRGAGTQVAFLFLYQGRDAVDFATTSRKISRATDRWLEKHVAPGQ
ncbi:MAG: ribonuclease P protein component [Flavobacteriales bacterium]|nr:ribonuclease P protein component [Flavobacteriales bacterium]